jgi:hypothetical protein
MACIGDIPWPSTIAPGRFSWRKYPDQINLRSVQKRLYDARSVSKSGYIIGSDKQGWMLTEKGVKFGRAHTKSLQTLSLSRTPMNRKEMVLHNRERESMITSTAFEKFKGGRTEAITPPEADAFFRLDEYTTGSARKEKMARIVNLFGSDPELAQAIQILSKKVRKV